MFEKVKTETVSSGPHKDVNTSMCVSYLLPRSHCSRETVNTVITLLVSFRRSHMNTFIVSHRRSCLLSDPIIRLLLKRRCCFRRTSSKSCWRRGSHSHTAPCTLFIHWYVEFKSCWRKWNPTDEKKLPEHLFLSLFYVFTSSIWTCNKLVICYNATLNLVNGKVNKLWVTRHRFSNRSAKVKSI